MSLNSYRVRVIEFLQGVWNELQGKATELLIHQSLNQMTKHIYIYTQARRLPHFNFFLGTAIYKIIPIQNGDIHLYNHALCFIIHQHRHIHLIQR